MSEEQAEEQKTPEPEQSLGDRIQKLFKGYEGAPQSAQIDAWKEQHGDIYVSAFDEQEIFVFRSLNRGEFRDLQENAAENQVDQFAFEELLVGQCLLWTSVANLNGKAGTIPTLQEQIMQHSNFVAPHVAAQMVIKL